MEAIGKAVRGCCSIPVIGGFVALIIAMLPLIVALPFVDGPYKYLAIMVAGLLIAAWCYLLAKKNIINITAPVIPIPFWVLGLVISALALYQHVFGPLGSL